MIDIYFTLSQAEYLEAQKLNTSKNRTFKWFRWGLLAFGLFALAVVVLRSPNRFDADAFTQFAPFFTIVLIALFLPFMQKSGFKKRFLKEKQNFTNARLVMDEMGYHLSIPGVGGGIAEWGGMDGWLEGKSVFLLRSGLLIRLFPKAPLDQTQLEEVRALLTEKLGPVGVMRNR